MDCSYLTVPPSPPTPDPRGASVASGCLSCICSKPHPQLALPQSTPGVPERVLHSALPCAAAPGFLTSASLPPSPECLRTDPACTWKFQRAAGKANGVTQGQGWLSWGLHSRNQVGLAVHAKRTWLLSHRVLQEVSTGPAFVQNNNG